MLFYQINVNVIISSHVCMVNTIYLFSFVETPRKFITAELSVGKLGSSSMLMKIRAYGSKALPIINLRGVSTKLNKYKCKCFAAIKLTIVTSPHSESVRK